MASHKSISQPGPVLNWSRVEVATPVLNGLLGAESLSSNSPSKLDREMKHGATNPFPFRVAPQPREKHDSSINLPSGKLT